MVEFSSLSSSSVIFTKVVSYLDMLGGNAHPLGIMRLSTVPGMSRQIWRYLKMLTHRAKQSSVVSGKNEAEQLRCETLDSLLKGVPSSIFPIYTICARILD